MRLTEDTHGDEEGSEDASVPQRSNAVSVETADTEEREPDSESVFDEEGLLFGDSECQSFPSHCGRCAGP